MATDAQRKAQRKYDETHKKIVKAIAYKSDYEEGLRLDEYLLYSKQNANAYIKGLIKKDLDEKGFYI